MDKSTPSPWGGRLLVLAALVVLGAVGILLGVMGLAVWTSWSGDQEWAELKANLQAKGEKLTLAEFIPPKVPDAENFFADPTWQEVTDKSSWSSEGRTRLMDQLNPPLSKAEVIRLKKKYPDERWVEPSNGQYKRNYVVLGAWKDRGQSIVQRKKTAEFVLETLEPARPWLEKLRELATRPSARATLNYERDFDMEQPHLVPLLTASQLLMTRGRAELAVGQNAAALTDALLILRLSGMLKTYPFIITYLVQSSMIDQALFVLADGLRMNAWNDEQLAMWEQKLAGLDLLAALPQAFRTERGGGNQMFDRLRVKRDGEVLARMKNRLFLGRDQAAYNRILQGWVDQIEATPQVGFQNASRKEIALPVWPFGLERFAYGNTLESVEALERARGRGLETQNNIGMGRVACALERWRLAKGSLPPRLADLVPEFLSEMPLDIINRQEFHYQLEPDGRYKLYSVAMNGLDDGGKTDANEDWVWGVPRARTPTVKK